MAPFFGGVIALALLGNILQAFDLLRSPVAQSVFGIGGIGAIAALVFWSVSIRARGARNLVLDAGATGVRLLEPSGTRVLSQVSRSAVTVTRSTWRYSTRTTSWDCPAITVAWAGQAPMTIGTLEMGERWSGVERGRNPTYLLASPDWQALIDALGVR